MLTVKHADLLNATETHIVHQCNCVSNTPMALAKSLFQAFPFANTYTSRVYGDKTTYSTPGSIDVCGGMGKRYVINMYAQYYPGRPIHQDTFETRVGWFKSCLELIKECTQPGESLALPYYIGCGAAGGDWEVYFSVIKNFAEKNKIKVVLYQI